MDIYSYFLIPSLNYITLEDYFITGVDLRCMAKCTLNQQISKCLSSAIP